jgi:branched-chain amino acid transport system permease protein
LIASWLPGNSRKLTGTGQPLPLLSKASTTSKENVLSVTDLSKHFGGLKALDGVNLSVKHGSVHALIGPNGSGKSTFINVVTGLYAPTKGEIAFAGQRITHMAPHARARCGLCRTFQNIRVFRGMSVFENVLIGAEWSGATNKQTSVSNYDLALAALEFVGLREEIWLNVGELSYGHQRYVEIARALAGDPQVLLLDEPAAGLNLSEKADLAVLLERLKGHGLTILIIDHDMKLVERVADFITVLNFGRHIAEGPARQVLTHPEVIAAYLGEPSSEAA